MKIGLKYCGGCNCKYDRSKVTADIRKSFPEAEFFYPDEESVFDELIVIAGCHVNCASHEHLRPRGEKHFITSEEEAQQIITKIRKKGIFD
ncbi:MAG: hypothetical protein Q4A78_04685 [Peptostreptococcaceae bacterium]|nr:hypothetical protein [Peptostreptococcaceae bacterium]